MTDLNSAPLETAPAKTPFLRRPIGRAALVVGALVAIGAGAAVARGGHHGGFAAGGMRGFERFCAVDVNYATQRMADGLTSRLNLNDAQKTSLGDLRQTAVTVGTDAKKLCANTPDMTTTPGRLSAMQARLNAANTAMTTLKPKIEAFYATLDDAQKKQFDAMGPMGRGKHGHGGRMGMGGENPMHGMGGMGPMHGMGGMAPRQ